MIEALKICTFFFQPVKTSFCVAVLEAPVALTDFSYILRSQ